MSKKYHIEGRCPMCGKHSSIELSEEEMSGFFAWGQGMNIQDALPQLNVFEREFLKSAYCVPCQEMLFGTTYKRTGKLVREDEEVCV